MAATSRLIAIVGVVVIALAAASGGGVAASGPPSPPAAYHGTVVVQTDSGTHPAPAGVTVTASVNGTEKDRIQTNASGAFGGSGAFDPKLTVSASDGATVQFMVEGKSAGTAAWKSNDDQELTLTVQGPLPNPENGEVAVGQAEASNQRDVTVSLDGANHTAQSVSLGYGKKTNGRVSVTERTKPPANVDPPSDRVAFYLDVNGTEPADNGSISMTVDRARIEAKGLSASSLRIHHYTNGKWKELETSVDEHSSSSVTFTAKTTGFSPYALAESSNDQQTTTTTTTDDGSSGSSGGGGGGGGGGGASSSTSTTTSTTTTTTTATSTTTTAETSTETSTSTTSTTTSTSTVADETSTSSSTESSGSSPGFTPVAAVIALLAVAALARRQR